jgi:hypothetical protein
MLDLSTAFDMIDHNILLIVWSVLLEFQAMHCHGSNPIWSTEPNVLPLTLIPPTTCNSSMVCRNALSWGLGCIACLQNQWERYAGVMECRIIDMQMTHKYQILKPTGDWHD